jgi:glycosyltransferase involved in cell wall biosynthesis
MPRVAILTGIFPPDIGGPATSVPDLAHALLSENHDVFVITLGIDTSPRPSDPCPVIRIPRHQPHAKRTWAVVRSVLHSRPDIVLANGLHVESALLPRVDVVQKVVGDWAWERARNAGTTDLDLEEFQTAKIAAKLHLLRLLRSHVTRRARLVIVPSRYLAGVVRRWGVSKLSIRVIPNAAPPIDSRAQENPRGNRALFVGRLVAWKQVDHVLRVLPHLPKIGLDIVGTGPEAESLQKLAVDLNVRERVAFLGDLPRQEVLDRMRQAAFLVLPSAYEGMPHVVLEAFAHRLPVVASDAAGTPELVDDRRSGLLYPCGNLGALEDAMNAVTVPEIAAKVTRGGFAVAERLSSTAMAKATRAVLEEVLP